jgi:hypothetical protein
MSVRYRRFHDISLSERILNSAFLLTIGIGYAFALANLWYTHQSRDGQRGLSVRDVMIAYHGSSHQTRLEAAINGIMEPNLKYKSDKEVIVRWLHGGAGEAEYRERVAPILVRDCITCHTPSINPNLPNLTTYEGVSEVARAGGASLPALIRVSHIHLFGIAFILYFIGRIFILSDINVTLKRITVAIPFVAMLLDVTAWYVTKYIPAFAYLVVGAGALMGISMGAQILVSLYQMWFHRLRPLPVSRPADIRADACRQILEDFGYGLESAGGGWQVREPSGRLARLESLPELEAFVRRAELRHQQLECGGGAGAGGRTLWVFPSVPPPGQQGRAHPPASSPPRPQAPSRQRRAKCQAAKRR